MRIIILGFDNIWRGGLFDV